ncbi:hypothetical protein K491DRAFT_698245 [Lophiostoma macrostomum CBS 122681]|uniref:NAD(P)-binding domain-containing protein n=1 Tax=Lophiostoma macrostomum CBS 122681 TaxID=1314788 RepID=A0A6A6SSX3_9PLEO|nr:hypothetical protein K491DRAFT_698245 [Lophiostoma macrostomum CBS 122681]
MRFRLPRSHSFSYTFHAMKIIITGVTGFIGGEVLHQAVADPAIATIYALSRKPLPEALAQLPKVTGIIHQDFSSYPTSLLEQLRGAEACIWMIGVPRPTGDPRPVDVGYTQAASTAFTTHLQPHLPPGKKFRFIYTSGAASETDQSKTLWANAAGRHSRGEAETALLQFARENEEKYQGFVVRPGLVCSRSWMVLNWDYVILLEWLALAMLGLAKEGGVSRVFENREMVGIGRRVVSGRRK